MRDTFLQSLESMLGEGSVDITVDPPVFRPERVEKLADSIRKCHQDKRGIAVLGAGTCPSTGSSSKLVQITTAALDTVSEVNVDDFIIDVQAGTVVDDLVAVGNQFGLYLPVMLASGDRATIGGTYMSGAFVGGQGVGRLGRLVTGVRAITGSGDIVKFGGRTVKNVTGFDVTRFLGGTLGLYAIVTDIIFKALPMPEYRTTVTLSVQHGSRPDLIAFITGNTGCAYTTCELLAPDGIEGEVTVGISFAGFKDLVNRYIRRMSERCGAQNGVEVKTHDESRFTSVYRAQSKNIAKQGMYTLTVPPASVTELLQKLSAIAPSAPLIGHLRHGRIHLFGIDTDAVTAIESITRSLGGTSLVAWGQIGTKGISSLMTASELVIAKSLKHELDPNGILNPHIKL